MKSRWLNTCKTDEEKESVRKQIKNATPVLKRLQEILREDLEKSKRDMTSRDRVKESASLEDLTAHYLGEQSSLYKVITLLDIEDK